MKTQQMMKDIKKLWSTAYGPDCIEELMEEYTTPEDIVKWVEDELYFYNTEGFAQYEEKEYCPQTWKENVKQLKSFLRKYKDK